MLLLRAFLATYRHWPLVVPSDSATHAKQAAIRYWQSVYGDGEPVSWIEVRVIRAPQYDIWAWQAEPDRPEEPCNCRVSEEARRIVGEMEVVS